MCGQDRSQRPAGLRVSGVCDGICDRVRERDCWLGFEGAIRLQRSCLSGGEGGPGPAHSMCRGPTLNPGGRGAAGSSRQRLQGPSQARPRAFAVACASLPSLAFVSQLMCVPRAAPSGEKGCPPPPPPAPRPLVSLRACPCLLCALWREDIRPQRLVLGGREQRAGAKPVAVASGSPGSDLCLTPPGWATLGELLTLSEAQPSHL